MIRALLLAAATLWLAQPSLAAETAKPNIILIFVDDMGYGDLGCYGNKLNKTPNIDRLAAEGQRWTSFYSSGATCVPSRRGLMTGRHPSLMGNANLVDSRDKLMPAMLKRHGYATAILGKWHLAGYPKDFTTAPMHPLECGFDYHYGTPGSNDVPAPEGRIQNRELFDTCDSFTFQVPLIRGREVVEYPADQELFTSRYTEQAVNWIRQHRDKPFFLYLAHNMPHAPVFASESFQGRSEGGRYGDVIEEIDWSVGQVLDKLRELDLAERTLVIFTSDNGPVAGAQSPNSAGPLRGRKNTTWEGGMREPCIMWWPGEIPAGATCTEMATSMDLLPTIARLAGGASPADRIIDGRDIWPLMAGKPAAETPHDVFYYYRDERLQAVRSGPWKLHVFRPEWKGQDHKPLLYHLRNDIGETTDVAGENPEVVERLLKLAEQARQDLGDAATGRKGENVRPVGQL